MLKTFTVQLDQPRVCCFNALAEDRVGQMDKPPSYSDLVSQNAFKVRRAVATFILCSLTGEDHPYKEVSQVLEVLPVKSEAYRTARDLTVEAVFSYLGVDAGQKKSVTPDPGGPSSGSASV